MQFKKQDKGSIFPENFADMQGVRPSDDADKQADILGDARRDDILSEIEFLNARMAHGSRHILAKNYTLENLDPTGLECNNVSRNNISDLVKMGHRLPEVKSVEHLLSSDADIEKQEQQAKENSSNSGIAPYRIVNLISGSYKLPDIDDESFFR